MEWSVGENVQKRINISRVVFHRVFPLELQLLSLFIFGHG